MPKATKQKTGSAILSYMTVLGFHSATTSFQIGTKGITLNTIRSHEFNWLLVLSASQETLCTHTKGSVLLFMGLI